MAGYYVINGDWLEREIATAETLREHAQGTGKSVAIAATGVRVESLKEILQLAVPATEEGPTKLAVQKLPRDPGRP